MPSRGVLVASLVEENRIRGPCGRVLCGQQGMVESFVMLGGPWLRDWIDEGPTASVTTQEVFHQGEI